MDRRGAAVAVFRGQAAPFRKNDVNLDPQKREVSENVPIVRRRPGHLTAGKNARYRTTNLHDFPLCFASLQFLG